MIDGDFLKERAIRCRELAETAIKWSIREELTKIAADLDRAAEELDAQRSVSKTR